MNARFIAKAAICCSGNGSCREHSFDMFALPFTGSGFQRGLAAFGFHLLFNKGGAIPQLGCFLASAQASRASLRNSWGYIPNVRSFSRPRKRNSSARYWCRLKRQKEKTAAVKKFSRRYPGNCGICERRRSEHGCILLTRVFIAGEAPQKRGIFMEFSSRVRTSVSVCIFAGRG